MHAAPHFDTDAERLLAAFMNHRQSSQSAEAAIAKAEQDVYGERPALAPNAIGACEFLPARDIVVATADAPTMTDARVSTSGHAAESRLYPMSFRDDYNGAPRFVCGSNGAASYLVWHPFYCFASGALGHYGRVYRYARVTSTADGRHLGELDATFDALIYDSHGFDALFVVPRYERALMDALRRIQVAVHCGTMPDDVCICVPLPVNTSCVATECTSVVLRVAGPHRGTEGMHVLADLMADGKVPERVVGCVRCGLDDEALIVALELPNGTSAYAHLDSEEQPAEHGARDLVADQPCAANFIAAVSEFEMPSVHPATTDGECTTCYLSAYNRLYIDAHGDVTATRDATGAPAPAVSMEAPDLSACYVRDVIGARGAVVSHPAVGVLVCLA